MKRVDSEPRKDWEAHVANTGFIWHTANGQPYWQENAYYSFSMKQIEEIEEATEECHAMFNEAAQYVIDNNLFGEFDIPTEFIPRLIKDWNNEPPALNYGRFDFGYDGKSPPKLFEYNADTPTSLVEASLVQWYWKEALFPEADQFNSIHEAFIARWKAIAPLLPKYVHFTHGEEETGEDAVTTAYMMDLAHEGGLVPIYTSLENIGWKPNLIGGGDFLDHEDEYIQALYKLYPWEWLTTEEFGKNILKADTLWIEPTWKMLFSNKAILPILWKLFPGHKNLLGAHYHKPSFLTKETENYVVKPTLAREGANVQIIENGKVVAETEGKYSGKVIYQERFALPNFSGKYPVIGSWCVDGAAVGMGIREAGLITGNTASFVPHIIEG
jgi:glutathionylspermidine synthase